MNLTRTFRSATADIKLRIASQDQSCWRAQRPGRNKQGESHLRQDNRDHLWGASLSSQGGPYRTSNLKETYQWPFDVRPSPTAAHILRSSVLYEQLLQHEA